MSGNTLLTPKFPGKVLLTVDDIGDRFSDFHIFDTRYSLVEEKYGINEYTKAHIPGATFVNVDESLTGPLTNTTARHPLPDVHVFIKWCKANGISPQKPVLCYDDQCGGMGACRMWWMLHALDVEAYVLNGGFDAYSAAQLPVESGPQKNKAHPVESWPYGTVFKRALTIDEVPPNALMVDSRLRDRFATTVRPYALDTVPGHIENAVCLPWNANVVVDETSKHLRTDEECRSSMLKALNSLSASGKVDVSKCVFYCGSSVTATFNIALLCHLGLGEPYLYCGSWSEYAGRFAFALARRAVEEYGMYFKMLSANLGHNPKAAMGTCRVVVDGSVMDGTDAEVESAVKHMHVGEKAEVYFKSGRTVVIEVTPAGQEIRG
ncbi:mercaptopyruvate sulfurtransferase [Trypanosoma theileri]|uniref:Mercaptopyruvate sulfurtransferase n=1 Tax=Trypanosoma theileri TaxID=67003 RepID=A0A1X0NKY9_9TRYP|nr:mercaptopyruvate sulfurtransferase [Trypanosoma theileri]ORC85123.1 mercaptopyruvate sulfurtransferase [Trypanosoma theileri]